VNDDRNEQDSGSRHTQRDAETLMLLGGFLMVISIPVMIGTIWGGHAAAMIINFLSGAIICAIGGGLFWRGMEVL
jgi:hypothetical protein